MCLPSAPMYVSSSIISMALKKTGFKFISMAISSKTDLSSVLYTKSLNDRSKSPTYSELKGNDSVTRADLLYNYNLKYNLFNIGTNTR